jgi:uncharacterized membrane protein (DUF485 family)
MSNEIIRAKKKIHALVNNQENLILTTGVICEASYIVLAYLALNQPRICRASIIGMVITILGMVFKLKEHEAETGEKMFWLHDEY